jgi:hypothetical protein
MFEHAAPLAHLRDCPNGQLFLVGPRVRQRAQAAPCAARRVEHSAGASWPLARVPGHVPGITVERFVNAILAAKENGGAGHLFASLLHRWQSGSGCGAVTASFEPELHEVLAGARLSPPYWRAFIFPTPRERRCHLRL